jgi:CRP-like cAMP-binding protein
MQKPPEPLLDPRAGTDILSHRTPFEGLDSATLEAIYARGSLVTIPKHSNVIVEGETSAGMYIVLEGLAGVYKSESDNRKGNLIKTITKGDGFGEMSLIDRAPRSATVTAEVDILLFYLSADQFDQLVESDAVLGLHLFRNFANSMSGRLRSLNDDLIVSQRQLWRVAFSRGDLDLFQRQES